MKSPLIELAKPGDGPHIARIMAEMQMPSILPMTIWFSKRADVHVEDIIANGHASGDAFTVLREEGEISAMVYLRNLQGSILVDSIYATPEARKRQLSALLCHQSLTEYVAEHSCELVVLDAFEQARSIRALHRSLGAREQSRRAWWVLPLVPMTSGLNRAKLQGLDEADQWHSRRGFSSFQVTTSSGTYTIGRLPGLYFRCTDPSGATDHELLESLAKLDGSRKLLMIAGTEWKPEVSSPSAITVRSVARCDDFLEKLTRLIPSSLPAKLESSFRS